MRSHSVRKINGFRRASTDSCKNDYLTGHVRKLLLNFENARQNIAENIVRATGDKKNAHLNKKKAFFVYKLTAITRQEETLAFIYKDYSKRKQFILISKMHFSKNVSNVCYPRELT